VQDDGCPIGWEITTDLADWERVPYKPLPPSVTSNLGVSFKQTGEPTSVVRRAFLDGAAMTIPQLQDLCRMLQGDIDVQKPKRELLRILIDCIFDDYDESQKKEVLDACIKPKQAKTIIADNDLTRCVVDELADDPENVDAVKEAKDTIKKTRSEAWAPKSKNKQNHLDLQRQKQRQKQRLRQKQRQQHRQNQRQGQRQKQGPKQNQHKMQHQMHCHSHQHSHPKG
jgi:hypothetical protein